MLKEQVITCATLPEPFDGWNQDCCHLYEHAEGDFCERRIDGVGTVQLCTYADVYVTLMVYRNRSTADGFLEMLSAHNFYGRETDTPYMSAIKAGLQKMGGVTFTPEEVRTAADDQIIRYVQTDGSIHAIVIAAGWEVWMFPPAD